MINRLVHPMFLTSLKLGESHESSTEVALDVVLKMLVTTWAKLVCSSSHVGMFWTEKVALSCGVKRRFSNTPKSVQPLGFSSSSACFALLLSTARSFSLLLRLTKASLAILLSVCWEERRFSSQLCAHRTQEFRLLYSELERSRIGTEPAGKLNRISSIYELPKLFKKVRWSSGVFDGIQNLPQVYDLWYKC